MRAALAAVVIVVLVGRAPGSSGAATVGPINAESSSRPTVGTGLGAGTSRDLRNAAPRSSRNAERNSSSTARFTTARDTRIKT